MKKCKECGEYTRTAYIRRMAAGISTWIPIGEFCPLCHSLDVSYDGDEIKQTTKIFVEKMLENPLALHVIEYLKENPPEKLDVIIDTVPELNVAISTAEDKENLLATLQKLQLINNTFYTNTGKLSLSVIVQKIISRMSDGSRKNNESPHGDRGVPDILQNPLYPKNKVPDVIEI